MLHLMAFAMDGFAIAAEALVGRAIGAKNHIELNDSLKRTALWSFAIACFFIMLYWLVGKWLIYILTGITTVRTMAQSYLIFVIIAPFIAAWSYWLDGIFIGSTRGQDMRNTMILAAIGFYITFFLLKPLGNTGLWSAFLIFLAIRAIILVRLNTNNSDATQCKEEEK